MKPQIWSELSRERQAAVLARPALKNDAALSARVAEIVARVRAEGDAALRALTTQHDRVTLDSLEVGASEFAAAEAKLTELKRVGYSCAAAANIEAFHRTANTAAARRRHAKGRRLRTRERGRSRA